MSKDGIKIIEAIEDSMLGFDLSDGGCDGCIDLYYEHGNSTCPETKVCEGSSRDCQRVEKAVSELFAWKKTKGKS